MRQSRKETSWKKSRKFGDVKGGRRWPKLADRIFNRQHSLYAPGPHEETPFFMQDNPSRDFFFPVLKDEIQSFLDQLPTEHTENLTHIWLRKQNPKEYDRANTLQGEFISGSGVNLIVLYPFPKDLKMNFGKKMPQKKSLNWYANFHPELIQEGGIWKLLWTEEGIKRYYLEGLLLHEIGHKMDSLYQRYWSKPYRDRAEKFADNFAFYWGAKIREGME